MKNFKNNGDNLDGLVAPYDLLSGQGALVGSIFSVASNDTLSGASFVGVTRGVFDLPKATGAVTQGAKIYWDNTAKNVTTTSSGNTLIGVATQAALSAAATASVKLGIVA